MSKTLAASYLMRLATLRMTHFLQPYWRKEEWLHAIGVVLGSQPAESSSALEEKVMELTGSTIARVFNLGRSAIQAALMAYRFPSASEVILPSYSCSGVIMPVLLAGLIPVFADIDSDFNLSVDSVRRAITADTRAIIFPHLGGKFARDTFDILSLARERKLKTIEDAAQAIGLKNENQWAGTLGDAGIFSFGGGKTLFGPSGGMLVSSDPQLIESLAKIKADRESVSLARKRMVNFIWRYGLQRVSAPFRFLSDAAHQISGAATRDKKHLEQFHYLFQTMSAGDAQLALLQLARLEDILAARKRNAQVLLRNSLESPAKLKVPNADNHTFTKFMVTTGASRQKSDSLRRWLRSKGIETEVGYTPLHQRDAFAQFARDSLPQTEALAPGAFSLPVNPRISENEMGRIARLLREYRG